MRNLTSWYIALGAVSLLFSGSSAAVVKRAPSSASATSTSSAPTPVSTACGDIMSQANNLTDPVNVFYAVDVYNCLISVPFNDAVATRFIKYYNDTIQFQSTLAYLKDPPTSYQKPAVDFQLGLEKIQGAINAGFFKNQYDFEASLQKLILSAYDSHLQLQGGILAAFSFGSERGLVSVSIDGKELPKIYLSADVIGVSQGQYNISTISAIKEINGIDVVEYLTGYAEANSYGTLEPHADWNQLMESPALDVQGVYSTFGGSGTFYPGDDLVFTHEDGTKTKDRWFAIYNGFSNTGPLETGGDFYNFFVLGFYPASYISEDDILEGLDDSPSATSTDDSSVPSATSIDGSPVPTVVSPDAYQTPSGWNTLGYPVNATLMQPDLSIYGGGVLTAYFDNKTSVAVLSIPSFTEYGNYTNTFQDFIYYFLTNATAFNMKNILIDVQQNSGGDFLLAVDTFKQFFPKIDPFGGSRKRAHQAANVLGNTLTQTWNNFVVNSPEYDGNSTSEWVSSDRLNAATNQNFSSWAEYYGPRSFHGDFFTTTQSDNLSSVIFDTEASDGIIVAGYTWDAYDFGYAAKDIAILSDGLCASACAVFMEMMHHEAGVRTIVAGGRPSYGPMQAPSGTRGASAYDTDQLDDDFSTTSILNKTAASLLPDRLNNDFYFDYAGFTIRDQVRRHENVPLQFVYEAADCRIFYTADTVYNFTKLWAYAAEAVWTNTNLCVQGSTGYSNINQTITSAPEGLNQNVNTTDIDMNGFYNMVSHLPDFAPAISATIYDGRPDLDILANLNKGCNATTPNLDGKLVCVSVPIGCGQSGFMSVLKQACRSNVRSCQSGATCNLFDANRQTRLKSEARLAGKSLRGFCPSQEPSCGSYTPPSSNP